MKRKKIVAVIVAAALVAGAVFGGVTLAKGRRGEVSVYPASEFITDADWISSSQTEGLVSTDRIQSVYVSDTQVVTEVYVEEGQAVKAGDPLVSFDTTLSELNLQRQSIKVDQLALDLQNAENDEALQTALMPLLQYLSQVVPADVAA